MNLFKKDPKIIFQFIFATILVVLAALLAVLLNRNYLGNRSNKINDRTDVIPVPKSSTQGETDILYIKLDSPSYAMSNFDINPATNVEVYLADLVNVEEFAQSFNLINEQTKQKVNVGYMEEIRKLENLGEGVHNWEKMWKQKISFIPTSKLDDASSYLIEITPTYRNFDQSIKIKSKYRYEFTTTDTFKFLNSNILLKGDFPADGKIKMVFTSPLNYNSLQNKISIEPSVGELDLKVVDKILHINNTFTRGTLYKVTIPSTTLDLYNRVLGEDLILEFKTAK